MPIQPTEIKTIGRLVFDLARGEETTTRSVEIPNPMTETSAATVQAAVNEANSIYTSDTNAMNILIQPSNWRDDNNTEQQWTTTGVHYEIVLTSITVVDPGTTPDTLGSAQENQPEEHHEEHQEG